MQDTFLPDPAEAQAADPDVVSPELPEQPPPTEQDHDQADAVTEPELSPEETPSPSPVSGAMSDAPLLDNKWGGFDDAAPVAYHEDGVIGSALARMGTDTRMEVDGQPLANVLGGLATDVVRRKLTAQEGLDAYKQVRDRLPEDSQARRSLDVAIMRMDAPATPAPQLPASTPEPLRQLANDLHKIPMVRADPTELDRIRDLAEGVAAGRVRASFLPDEVRRIRSMRHESTGDTGYFEIRDAVQRATDALNTRRT
ncbi:hypothetical protein [Actinophytocola sediminis]